MIPVPILAVLLTCHNRKDKTLQCLTNLFKQEGFNEGFKLEVFLVDDACTDGTGQAVRNQFPLVNIIQGNGNLFWNRGMYLAWKTAVSSKNFDYYLWLNDDTFLLNEAIINLLEAAVNTDNKSAICGSTFSSINKVVSYGGNSKQNKILTPNGNLQEVFTFNGNVVLIPKYVYEIVGILDKRFPHAIGDFEYALRVRSSKLKSYISTEFVGSCERNINLPLWCSPTASIKKRIKSLYSPLGNSHPYYYFLFELKYYGLITAIKHFFSIHLRLILPQLWIRSN